MNIINRIRNIKFAKKVLNSKFKKSEIKPNRFFNTVFTLYSDFKKNGYERNLMSQLLKKLRKQHPYEIIGWSKVKEKYDEYFTLDGAISSMDEAITIFKENGNVLYVTMFRDESFYQVGENPYHYSRVNTYLSDNKEVHKMRYLSKNEKSLAINEDVIKVLNKQWLTAFRYSTEEEIMEYEIKDKKIWNIQNEIDIKFGEIDELRKEKNKI